MVMIKLRGGVKRFFSHILEELWIIRYVPELHCSLEAFILKSLISTVRFKPNQPHCRQCNINTLNSLVSKLWVLFLSRESQGHMIQDTLQKCSLFHFNVDLTFFLTRCRHDGRPDLGTASITMYTCSIQNKRKNIHCTNNYPYVWTWITMK